YFDCSGLVKALLWRWTGQPGHTRGGSTYQLNGIPDKTDQGIIDLCREVSTDFSRIEVGEVVHSAGHIGIYVGGGRCVEATTSWSGDVCYSTLANTTYAGSNLRVWARHGKLPWLKYGAAAAPITPAVPATPDPVPAPAAPATPGTPAELYRFVALEDQTVYAAPDAGSRAVDMLKKGTTYRIQAEQTWGRMYSGVGWIPIDGRIRKTT
ncbi:MAG: hypothetical protein FWE70_04615, partial [Oscillospiraceae bacterium]|nr:hypothetical protein [Oscillospiraceae bacterium]